MEVTRPVTRGLPLALYPYMEQRRTERVTLRQPVAAVVNGEHVYVMDASTRGVRLSHPNLIPQGTKCGVALEWIGLPSHSNATSHFEWDGKPIHFVGQQRWT